MKNFTRLLTAAVVFAACSLNVAAEETPQFVRFSVMKVKPEMVNDFIEAQKQATAAYKKMGVAFRDVWRPAAFGDQGTWLSVVPITKLSDWDTPGIVAAMGGKEAYQQWLDKASRCVTDVRYTAELMRPDISLNSGEKPGMIVVGVVSVVTGKEPLFESKFEAEVMPALKKSGVKDLWVTRTVAGGSISTFTIASKLSSMGDLEKGSPVQRALGPEAFERWREGVIGIETSVMLNTYQLVPDLSYAITK